MYAEGQNLEFGSRIGVVIPLQRGKFAAHIVQVHIMQRYINIKVLYASVSQSTLLQNNI